MTNHLEIWDVVVSTACWGSHTPWWMPYVIANWKSRGWEFS